MLSWLTGQRRRGSSQMNHRVMVVTGSVDTVTKYISELLLSTELHLRSDHLATPFPLVFLMTVLSCPGAAASKNRSEVTS